MDKKQLKLVIIPLIVAVVGGTLTYFQEDIKNYLNHNPVAALIVGGCFIFIYCLVLGIIINYPNPLEKVRSQKK
ncbi:hypothetical protein [Bacillus licheniformis]|uniref:hypothetical protein n=1 Tax=Bacillus licheniformis TaxID=1402 RepID=UPI00119D5C16|nr:hypothetical protein [Bacillus licheniformis]MCA1183034.1 hypothetical protein [Bacillus licheniformis]